ncbi:DUF805 domain-containing protein [Sphingomonas sp. G-3-2-10]|uniref:DUF805 domain-containing protein n=1 Tax=Sphingomonas sp. G-3-2-10 TaxID=2728838 RepID=UPI00146EE1DA|nr:DUF805 domain-containing protein [Sphingomonas sp. G-3-2-10]NML06021.1 DUF805 domain-containing protein [Sphingomonas sp. G-3-2-10]
MEAASSYSSTHWRYLVAKPFLDMFVFSGRSTRTEALGFTLVASFFIHTPPELAGDYSNPLLVVAGLALGLVLHLPIYALVVRRAHDQGASALWVLLPIVQTALAAGLVAVATERGGTGVNLLIWKARTTWSMETTPILVAIFSALIIQLLLFFSPPTPGPNRYGPDPRLPDTEPPVTAA